jgi:hypothetical protein
MANISLVIRQKLQISSIYNLFIFNKVFAFAHTKVLFKQNNQYAVQTHVHTCCVIDSPHSIVELETSCGGFKLIKLKTVDQRTVKKFD